MQQTSTGRLLILLIASLVTTSCFSIKPLPVTRLPEGNVKRLMEMPEFTEVRSAGNDVKRWAKEALHVVNDLEYRIRSNDNSISTMRITDEK